MPPKLDELNMLITTYDKLFNDGFISLDVYQSAITAIKFLILSIQVE